MGDRFQKDIEYIVSIIREAGYNPYEQLYGYLYTGDKTYITRKGNARELVESLDHEKIWGYIEPYIKRKK